MEGFASNLGAINAARKQFGKDWKQFVHIEKVDGKFYPQHIQQPQEQMAAAIARDQDDYDPAEQESQVRAAQSAPAFEALPDASPQPQLAAAIDLTEAQAQADAIANSQASEQSLPNGKVWIRLSSIPKPTKQVWHIADEMLAQAAAAGEPAPSRKAVQDECVRRGIASGTARTQYQAWKKARDESAANNAAALAASARFNQK